MYNGLNKFARLIPKEKDVTLVKVNYKHEKRQKELEKKKKKEQKIKKKQTKKEIQAVETPTQEPQE